MKTLIVGGSKGLGKELACRFHYASDVVHVASRSPLGQNGVTDHTFDATADTAADDIDRILGEIGAVDRFFYLAGAADGGLLDEFSPDAIGRSITVNFTAAVLWLRALLFRQGSLEQCVLVTSTSATTPRGREPVYSAAKAGLRMLGRSLAQDERVKSVCIIAPAGMDTTFWAPHRRLNFLDPSWVADEAFQVIIGRKPFREVKILRDPPRVEEV